MPFRSLISGAGAALLLSAGAPVTGQPMTRDNGAPIGDNQNSQTAGPAGPVLLQDGNLIQKLQRFDRERIPERVVHARGTGAYGEFTSSADISGLTRADVFRSGSRTPVFVRFSTVIFGQGSPETVRDPRGFAVKFYSTQGNWDLVGNNLPVFFIRDAIKFPDVIHALKPAPDTNLQDPQRVFDLFSRLPESTHMLTRLYSDFGTPRNYRVMDGNGVHAYKFVNSEGEIHYVKFHWKSLQNQENLSAGQASQIQARDFSHATRDLVDSIRSGAFPRWDLYIQTVDPRQLAAMPFDGLDATKIWPDVPERKIGQMVLDRNPENVFQETEQSAFAPSNLVPGIEASEDRMLQGRLFSYADTQLHRVGTNHAQLPVNRPRVSVANHHQDGSANAGQRAGSTNYEPAQTSAGGLDPAYRSSPLPPSGTTQQMPTRQPHDFEQAGAFYRSLSELDKTHLIANLAGDLGKTTPAIRQAMLAHFTRADADYGKRLAAALNEDFSRAQAVAARLAE